MRLRNKKTGEITDLSKRGLLKSDNDGHIIVYPYGAVKYYTYTSLAELNEEWEDYEEPEEFWFINDCGDVLKYKYDGGCSCAILGAKAIGNYFETKEEAEKAVKKLKAWKRLKEKGLRFERWGIGGEYGNTITFSDYIKCDDETRADLDLLFGGEE